MTARKDVNQYEKALLSDRNMIKSNSQMEQCSILSDNIEYVKLEDNDIMNGINIKLIDYRDDKRMYRKMGKEGRNSQILTSGKVQKLRGIDTWMYMMKYMQK